MSALRPLLVGMLISAVAFVRWTDAAKHQREQLWLLSCPEDGVQLRVTEACDGDRVRPARSPSTEPASAEVEAWKVIRSWLDDVRPMAANGKLSISLNAYRAWPKPQAFFPKPVGGRSAWLGGFTRVELLAYAYCWWLHYLATQVKPLQTALDKDTHEERALNKQTFHFSIAGWSIWLLGILRREVDTYICYVAG